MIAWKRGPPCSCCATRRSIGSSLSTSKFEVGTTFSRRRSRPGSREKIHYATPVVKIEQHTQGVKATFRQAGAYHTLTGDYLICAVPFSVQKNIEVAPAFSVEKQLAIEQLPYLSASKIFLQSKKRFWVDEGLSGFATTDLPVSQVWDTTYAQPGTRGILQAFPISLHSRRVTAMSESERINFALEHVDTIYPGMRNHFEGGVTKCWDEDEWARGVSRLLQAGPIQLAVATRGAARGQNPFRRRAHLSVD